VPILGLPDRAAGVRSLRAAVLRRCADNRLVPRWAWLRFGNVERVAERWDEIDRRAGKDIARIKAEADHRKRVIHIAAIAAALAPPDFATGWSRGRPRIHSRTLRRRPVAPPLLRERAHPQR
jgi:hypothetical protein